MNARSTCHACLSTQTRRAWIRRLALSCTAIAALPDDSGPSSARAAISDFKRVLRIDISALPPLALNSGSVLISIDNGISAILINRESDTDFYAIDPTCPHMGCRVDPYSIVTNTITCPCHGSQFSISGQVVGRPAVTSLFTFPVQFEAPSTLKIEVPNLVHRVDSLTIHSTTPTVTRMRLSFPTMNGSLYEVRHSPDLAAPFQPVAFATTPGGAPSQTLFTGNGATATVYVDVEGPAGFFTLDLLVQQLAP